MFSAWDCQCGGYFHSGANCETPEQCKKEVLEMLLNGDDVTDGVFDLSMEEQLEVFEVEIHEHKEPIEPGTYI